MKRNSHISRSLQRRSRGVALFYFLMVFGMLLGFLMLVVNTGMIVYQKIRLQSTADLAAYAGAAVQASYLGNASSGDGAIKGINYKMLKRYAKLTQDLEDLNRKPVPWPGLMPIPIPGEGGRAACMAMCAAANIANSQFRVSAYKSAAKDLAALRKEATAILDQIPEKAQKAAEATVKLNIPELTVDGSLLSSLIAPTTNKVEDIVQNAKSGGDPMMKKKNAVLGFTSDKGMYLANIVATVPHTFVFYGPICSSMRNAESPPVPSYWYCHVNGSGAGGGQMNYAMAAAAFGRSFAPQIASGNIGTIDKISDKNANAIRLHFIQNPNKPDPFFVSALEWNPGNGSFMNMENSLGATGSLFPKQTRLVAVAAAEPFGGSLIGSSNPVFGVRLQSIRKVLLDPRMKPVQKDFPGLMDYMESLSPLDASGRPTSKPEDVIRRFLH